MKKKTAQKKHLTHTPPPSYASLLKLFADFMDNVPDVIYFKDRKGRLLFVNHAHAKGLGLKPSQVVGKSDFDFFPKKKALKMAKDDAHVLSTGKPIIDKIERATRADGIDNYSSTTKIPRFDDKGRVIGLMGITRDITHRMQIKRLQEEKDQIERKLKALEDLSKMKSEFVSIVSHELRTPLAIIKEATMLISDGIAGSVNEKQKNLLAKAQENIERLRRIIEDLLDVSRIEKGTMKLRYSLVNLNELIKDSSEFFKKRSEERFIDLSCHLPREQLNIFIDAEKIVQVLSNLLNNALKFSEENGKIKIEVQILENKIRIGIIDTGIGIAERDISRLFNKFVQVTKKIGIQRQGLGLGLAIARDLVEKHGGEIWVESKLGVGTKFYFTLPRLYTTRLLDTKVRERINFYLDKNMPLYLINISIINFEDFRDRTTITLAKDLRELIQQSCFNFNQQEK
ncbi:MAG: cell wall metabolism sensor histidine kinase WalK, partial [Candidatus Omnitrophica bacterium]|nr:cell wall metabolism sensor histidine kinase WalK [Candidatus Omnitrophota bacterium]